MPDPLCDLIGRTIQRIRVEREFQHWLVFDTDEGPVSYEVEGDCCSESWFSDISGTERLLGAVVEEVKSIPLEDYNLNDGRGRDAEDEVYGYLIRTDKGAAVLAFRNSSNGYYGGWMERRVGIPDEASLVAITADWRAD